MKKAAFFIITILSQVLLYAQSFTGTGGSVPASSNTATCFSTTVSGVGVINSSYGLAQVCIDMTHPDVGDLEILLRAPDGTYVPLTMQNGGSGNNFTNTCFTGTATNAIKFGTAPFTGIYKPEGYIGAVNNGQNANGTWSICVTDIRNTGSQGTLNSFTLTFNNTPAPQAPALPACTKTMPVNTSCANATLICDFTGLCGSTSGTALTWTQLNSASCFGIQNNSFIQFVASATTASFDVWVNTSSGATFTTGGIQMLFFSGTCGGAITSYGCYNHILPSPNAKPLITVVTAQGLTIGNTYYMMIDGYNNANTTFTIKAASGISEVNVTPPAPVICQGQNVNLTASGGNGVFAWSPATNLSAATGATVTASPTTTTTYTVSSTSPTGCPLTKDVVVTVTPSTPPITGFSYDKISACSNSANPVLQPDAGFTTGGTFAATPAGLSINATTGAINVAASTAGDYTITYSIPASGCNAAASSSFGFSVYTNTLPITGFRYLPATVCQGGSNPVLDKDLAYTTGGVYSAQPAGLSLNTLTGAINVATSSPGTYKIYYSLPASGCTLAGFDSTNFTITPATTPVTGFNYTPNSVCTGGANPTLNTNAGFTSGGIFSATPAGLSINATTGAINVAASTAGTYTVKYEVVASGCNSAAESSITFTISSAITPVTGFGYSLVSVCENGANPVLNTAGGFTTGGTFSATPAGLSINATTGAINVAASSPGSYTIRYDIAASGCMQSAFGTTNFAIIASSNPVTAFAYTPNTLCASGTTVLNTSSGFTAGGIFSATPAGLSINATTGAIDVAASTPGTYTVTYTVNAVGCVNGGNSQTTITINPASTPVTGFSYSAASACANGSAPTVKYNNGFTTGGVFTATPSGLNINPGTGAITLAGSQAGDYTITYTVAATGCTAGGSSQSNFSIYTNTLPITGFRYLPATVCQGGSNPVIDKDLAYTAGGVYSAQPAGLIINATSGNIDVAASSPGMYKVYYTVAASGCTLAGIDSTTFTINTVTTPVTGFSYSPNTVCAHNSNPILNTVPGFSTGGIFSAPAGIIIDASTGIINVSASTPGNYLITYTVGPTGCAVGSVGTTNFTIEPTITPVTNFSYTPTSTCATGTLSLQTATGFSTGGSFSAAPGLSLNNTTGAINPATSTAGNYIVTYTVPESGCRVAASNTATVSITGLQTPVTDFSYIPATVCINSSNPVLNTANGFATGGSFTATPAGLSINGNTGAINLATSTAGTYTITYTIAANGCFAQGTATTSITITNTSSPVTGFSYDVNNVCSNGNAPLLIVNNGFATGGTFSASPQGLNINQNTGAISLQGSTPGSYTISYSVNASGCVLTGSSATNLTINATPIPPSVANGRHCGPGIVPLTATGTGTIRWYDDVALNNLVHTGLTYNPDLTATTVYRVTATSGNCTSSPTIVTATIGSIPQPPFLGNDTAICDGDMLILDAGVFANYTWQDGTGIRTYTVRSPGQYSVTVGNSDGCTSSSSINITTEAECSDIYFPGAFAPDGKNKFFGPISPTGNVSGITRYSLTVYNRYGQIVFISTNPSEKWDGTFKGKKLGTQAFVWYSEYLYRNRITKKQKGTVVLVR